MRFCNRASFILQQWLTGIGVSLLIMQVGFMSGWTSPTIARLLAPDSVIPLTAEGASWVASLLNLSRLAGAVLGATSGSLLGGKKTILFTLIIVAVSWLVTSLAGSVEWLCVARLFGGVGFGMSLSIFPLFLGEVAVPEIRGALVSLASMGQFVGQIIASFCGSVLSMSTAAYVYLACCTALMIFFFFLPESPHHLVKIGRLQEAKEAISWYRNGENVDLELKAIQEFVSADKSQNFLARMRKFGEPATRKATLHVITLYILMQVCGLNSVLFYMEIILIRAKFTVISPASTVIYVNTLGTFSSFISISLIDRCGRRILLIVSSTGVCASMIGLASYFVLLDRNYNVENMQWLPMSSMFLFVLSFSIGLLSIPGTIMSEIFPSSVKCIAACITGVVGAVMSFLSAKSFQPMVDWIGEAGVFVTYAVSAIIVVPYVIFLLPETKGKTLLQIQNQLVKER